jgi:hypothetical protein
MAATSFSFINGSPNCEHKAGSLAFERPGGAGSGVWAWRDVCCRMYDALNASNCRSIPTRCGRGQAIGREGNRLLGTCATYALGPSMGAVGRLQGETGSEATATIKLTHYTTREATRGGGHVSARLLILDYVGTSAYHFVNRERATFGVFCLRCY